MSKDDGVKCKADAHEVSEGIWLCLACEDKVFNAMRRLRRKRSEDTREIERLSRRAAGPSQPKPPLPIPHRGEVAAGRFEENRSKH